MSPEAVAKQPRHPDRRKLILVLSDLAGWTENLRGHVGNEYRLEIPTEVTIADLTELAQRPWRLVLMTSVSTTLDQRSPLEALRSWTTINRFEPVTVLSPMPDTLEARDALYMGAVWYDEVPWSKPDVDKVLRRSLREAQRHRRHLSDLANQGYLGLFQSLHAAP